MKKPFNLMKWIEDHQDEFKKPVMNKQFYELIDEHLSTSIKL